MSLGRLIGPLATGRRSIAAARSARERLSTVGTLGKPLSSCVYIYIYISLYINRYICIYTSVYIYTYVHIQIYLSLSL